MEKIPVENENSYDPRSSEYFATLPPYVQEAVMQSAGLISNEEELRATAENLKEI